MVSVSRSAFPEHLGQFVSRNSEWVLRGDSPLGLNSASSGNKTGKSDSLTGVVPHLSQYTIGIGVPQ